MSLLAWIASYALNLLFWTWVLRWGGAERLEGTLSSGLLVSGLAPRWTADGIKLFGWISLAVTTVGFGLGIFIPGWRN